jgi:hypothetical protein
MKTLLSFLLIITLSNITLAQNTAIPDANFEQALIDLGYDTGVPNGLVVTANVNTITYLNVDGKNISDLTGIEDFTALTDLVCSSNQLTSLDVTQNTALTYLYCTSNQLTSLVVTQNTALTNLACVSNQLTSLDVTQSTALISLHCFSNQLTSLDVTQNTALTSLYCSSNQLTSLDVTQNTALITLHCSSNQLTSLNVTQNTTLTSLYSEANQLTSLDVTQNTALHSLLFLSNQLTSLDVTQNTALTHLSFAFNQLTSLDVTQNIALNTLYCLSNQLTSLDLTQNTALTTLRCDSNQLTCLNVKNGNNLNFNYFDSRINPNLTCIEVDDDTWSTANWVNIDAQTSFSTYCGNPCSSTTVDIEEQDISNLSIYPNPTSNKFTIEGINSPFNLTIYNSVGQILHTENNILEPNKKIDVSVYKSGLIFIRIESNGEVITKKIIKE